MEMLAPPLRMLARTSIPTCGDVSRSVLHQLKSRNDVLRSCVVKLPAPTPCHLNRSSFVVAAAPIAVDGNMLPLVGSSLVVEESNYCVVRECAPFSVPVRSEAGLFAIPRALLVWLLQIQRPCEQSIHVVLTPPHCNGRRFGARQQDRQECQDLSQMKST